jgi:spore coat polysaccharide biosynthesis protein SpsF (cytidylyltransferase family)
LSLGPISEEKVHVRFRGRRRYASIDANPAVIEIEGDCPFVSEA